VPRELVGLGDFTGIHTRCRRGRSRAGVGRTMGGLGAVHLIVTVLVLSTRAFFANASSSSIVQLRTESRVPHAEGRWVAVFRNVTSAEQRADHIDRHRGIAAKVCVRVCVRVCVCVC
jgi:hypothetical protein